MRGLSFLFYLRTWVQQQQLESAATLKFPRDERAAALREVQILASPCVCLPVFLSPFAICILFLTLFWQSGGGLVGFSCWLRSLWRERYTYSAQRRRDTRGGRHQPCFSRQTGEREQQHSLMGLRARREDQPAVLLLCTCTGQSRNKAAWSSSCHLFKYRSFPSSLLFSLWFFFAAVCAGFVAVGFVDLKRASKRNQEC